ncbi:unnamed protein product [Kuraishia capsulata CBS 1993]|uniref:MHD domain-containing protein n=1 Tax=Kuraishia capsulata CBS 1993 TaxID=1382522 RepID=W6MRK1_9ASCO|nr:uncharacterized protein KUCA_T00004974001 [Kuraishia capsulata CBS 1993]CDK28988.1 unnamed protein product [Kuraishia capsulata CBS 1993]
MTSFKIQDLSCGVAYLADKPKFESCTGKPGRHPEDPMTDLVSISFTPPQLTQFVPNTLLRFNFEFKETQKFKPMGLIESLYIADQKGKLLFEYSLRPSTPGHQYIFNKLRYAKDDKKDDVNELKGGCFLSGLASLVELESNLFVAWKKLGPLVVIVVGSGYTSPVEVAYTKEKVVDEGETSEEESEEESEEGSEEESEQESVEEYEEENNEFQESEYEEERDESENEGEQLTGTTNHTATNVKIHPTYNPLLYHDFIDRVISAMNLFLGKPITVALVESNSDTLVLLLQEMVDADYPYITDLNQLKDLLPSSSILKSFLDRTKKFSESAQKSFSRQDTLPGRGNVSVNRPVPSSAKGTGNGSVWEKSGSSTPWRRSNVKYTNNEMFVDVTERITVIIPPSKSGRSKSSKKIPQGSAFYSSSSYLGSQNTTKSFTTPIVARIDGKVIFTSRLSGIPNLKLVMSPGRHDLGVPSFHPCVDIAQWVQTPGTLSFVPPDGAFNLMDYSIDLLNNPLYSDNARELSSYMGLVSVDLTVGLGLNANEFEIQVNTTSFKAVKGVDDLKLEIVISDPGSKAGDSDETPLTLKSLRMTHGDLRMTEKGTYEWGFDKLLTLGVHPSFRGALLSDSDSNANSNNASDDESITARLPKRPLQPKFVRMSYGNKGCLPSGIKVDLLKITSAQGLGENVKPYKGVKYITEIGQYVLR